MERAAKLRQTLRLEFDALKVRTEPLVPYVYAVVVGLGAAVGAIIFRELIRGFDWLLFDQVADRGLSGLSDWRVLLIPALGGLVVGPLIYFFAREAKGHGVPEVMLAIETERGRIRPRVAVVKSLASALTIASGGSAGREGPIVQIASAIGSTLGQITKLSDDDVRLLVAAGAAGGISATFNAPIAGVFFALEVILRRFNARNFSVVVLSSVVAAAVAHARFGDNPAFRIPEYRLESPFEYPLYAALGVLAALAAVIFIRVLYRTEDIFDSISMPEWLKPALGGLGMGLLGVWYISLMGVGYGSGPGAMAIPAALAGESSLQVLIALAGLKILATSLTIGSGGSGGVFAPSLFIGAMMGGAFGLVVNDLWPGATAPAGAYALVGMAAVFAGSARAPITAVIILFEMTNDYSIILPLMTAVVISTAVAQLIMSENIYTLKLRRRGIDVTERPESAVLSNLTVAQAMRTDFKAVRGDLSADELVNVFSGVYAEEGALPVVDENKHLIGIVAASDLDQLVEATDSAKTVDDVATHNPVTVHPDETLDDAVRRMADRSLRQLPIVSRRDPTVLLGVLRRSDIFAAYTKVAGRKPRPRQARPFPLAGLEAYGTEIVEVALAPGALVVGSALRDVDLPEQSVVVSIIRDGLMVIPRGDVELRANDRVVVAAMAEAKAAVLALLREAGSAP